MKHYSKQFRECYRDGTAKKMTEERIAKLNSSDRKMIESIMKFRSQNQNQYSGGPLFCGKVTGICSSKHCPLTLLLAMVLLCFTSSPAKPTNETLKFLKTLPNSTNYIREYNQHGPPGTNRMHKPQPKPIK